MKKRLALLLVLLGGCAAPPEAPDPAAARAHARAVTAAEARAAVAVIGARVCRRVTAGIGNHEWVSGVVVEVSEASPEWVMVRIDKPGRMSHVLDGVLVARGATLRGASALWTPCE